jgi:hypothetical protein
MFWSLAGRPVLLLPVGLWERLTAEQRDSLLLHELAHVRRRDHWVRLFELVVTVLYWWHPVVWWARSELRRAEEDCCDAWVVWATPGKARAYAAALVETVDFLSEAPVALPVGASGMGPAQDLRRRVTMIMQGRTPRSLTWSGIAGVFSVAALLLPTVPTFAQRPDTRERPPVREGRDPDAKKADDLRAADLDQMQAELEKAKAEFDKAAAELQKAQAVLKERQAHLEKLAADILRARSDNAGRQPDPKRGELPDGVTGKIIIIGPDGKKLEFNLSPDGKLPPDITKMLNDLIEKQQLQFKMDPKILRVPEDMRAEELRRYLDGARKQLKEAPDNNREDRMKDLEARMEKLTRELERLRAELKKSDDPRKSELPQLPRDSAVPAR